MAEVICRSPKSFARMTEVPPQGWNCVYPNRGSAVVLAMTCPAALSQVRRSRRSDAPMANAAYLRPSATRGVTSWVDPSERVAFR